MRNYICSTGGCPAVIDHAGHCPEHERARDAARGRRQARGVGADHDRLRRKWAPVVARGGVACWRCGELIGATEPFDLGHDDDDRSVYRGPEHRRCNRATSGRRKR